MNRPIANMRLARHQRGVTLVELLISLALGLAVLVGLSAVYVAAKQSFRFQETGGRMQEDAMFALETISRDMRMTGFAGCRGVEKINIAGVDTYYPSQSLTLGAPSGINGPNPLAIVEPLNVEVILKPLTPSNFLRGFDNVPAAMFATAPTSSATHSVFFSGGSEKAVSMTSPMAAVGDPLAITAGSAAFLDPAKVYNMIVANCNTSSLFAGQLVGGGTQIAHTALTGNATVGTNAANSFPSAPLYGVDAIVMPLEWSFYYVATRPGAATPSLYRIKYDGSVRGNAEELVSNVESMRLHYGENTVNDAVTGAPTMQADIWRTTAGAVTDWSRVMAVRVGLMMVSEDNAANLDVASAAPTLLGEAYAGPVGKSATRLRKEFSTTVVLRNRIAPR